MEVITQFQSLERESCIIARAVIWKYCPLKVECLHLTDSSLQAILHESQDELWNLCSVPFRIHQLERKQLSLSHLSQHLFRDRYLSNRRLCPRCSDPSEVQSKGLVLDVRDIVILDVLHRIPETNSSIFLWFHDMLILWDSMVLSDKKICEFLGIRYIFGNARVL